MKKVKTVRDLQERLSELDPDLEVVFYSEDDDLSAYGRKVSVFGVVDITVDDAEIIELESGVPWPKFERGPASSKYVFVEITSDQ